MTKEIIVLIPLFNGFVFLVVGFVFLVVGVILLLYTRSKKKRCTCAVDAKIVDIIKERHRDIMEDTHRYESRYFPVYEYYINGKTYKSCV